MSRRADRLRNPKPTTYIPSAGLRVRTGVRAPALIERVAAEWAQYHGPSLRECVAAEIAKINMTPLVPLIRCTMPAPCGVCWYCKRHDDDQPNGSDNFEWERPF